MPSNVVNGFNINGVSIPYNYDALGNKLEKTSIAREYSNIDTYDIDEYVIYNGKMYRCKQKILVGESFDPTKWVECSIGLELNYIKEFMTWSDGAKNALLNLLTHVAYTDEHGQDYYDELEAELFRTAEIVSISAVFDQGSAVIYDTDDLDTLRQYLTVTATYEDLSEREITGYTLSGTLTEGTSTITVLYSGKTATFDVAVTEYVVPDTTPVIVTTGAYRSPSNNSTITSAGWGITKKYKVRWQQGDVYKIKVANTTSPQVGLSAYTGTENSYSTQWSVSGTKDINVNYTFANCWLEASIKLADIADTYLYNNTSGDIVFAGANTPYYGKQNIHE